VNIVAPVSSVTLAGRSSVLISAACSAEVMEGGPIVSYTCKLPVSVT
jgi:hypothetical protein